MKIRVCDCWLYVNDLSTRIPFKYGIATLTRTPHLLLRADVEIDGRPTHGFAADNLAPKWFTKDPATTYRADLAQMLEVIRHACDSALAVGAHSSVFDLWRETYAVQKVWAAERRLPPLLWGFGVSMIERAVIDAFCRGMQTTFAAAVQMNSLGLRLGEVYPELGCAPADYLPWPPREEIEVRHTVGLSDPLTVADVPAAERVADGLPQTLEECVRAMGLTHFKIKLCGDVERDRARLRALAELLEREAPGCRFTLDGNENYRAVEPFAALWEQLRADAVIARFLEGLIFVEQPLHRDVALAAETTKQLLAWKERPPIIIDESEGEVGTLAVALAGGYAGTSHKNCKGVIKGIANACLIAHRRKTDPSRELHLSGEDLTNVGLALLQDLAVVATLGIGHAERNGHHYFDGLKQFPPEFQKAMLAAHADLYEAHAGYPVVRVSHGRMSTRSAVAAPFGCAFDVPVAEFTALDAWRANGY
jgi:hypothetical protein